MPPARDRPSHNGPADSSGAARGRSSGERMRTVPDSCDLCAPNRAAATLPTNQEQLSKFVWRDPHLSRITLLHRFGVPVAITDVDLTVGDVGVLAIGLCHLGDDAVRLSAVAIPGDARSEERDAHDSRQSSGILDL